jgi:hypothetical protein
MGRKKPKPKNGSAAKAERLARQIDAAVQSAVRDALIMHKRMGNPVAFCEDDRVVWVQPDEIEIPEEPRAYVAEC